LKRVCKEAEARENSALYRIGADDIPVAKKSQVVFADDCLINPVSYLGAHGLVSCRFWINLSKRICNQAELEASAAWEV
jgi:hypothetical protein